MMELVDQIAEIIRRHRLKSAGAVAEMILALPEIAEALEFARGSEGNAIDEWIERMKPDRPINPND